MVAYRLWRPGGPRRVVVLLHGLASNATRWSELVAHTSLRADWDLLRLDLRGNGASVWRGRLGMREWCADLAEILDAEGCARGVLVGHCLGANVARLEMKVAFEVLLNRLPNLRIDPTADPRPYMRGLHSRGPSRLPLLFDPTTA